MSPHTTRRWRSAVLWALVLLMALPAVSPAADPTAAMDGEWHFVVAPYMWFSGIEGSVSVARLPSIPVELTFSDLWEDFDFGLQGHFEGRKDRFGFGLDGMWVDLGAPVAPGAPIVDFTADVRQVLTEGFVFYRVASGGREDNPAHVDVFVGARYMSTKTRLTADSTVGIEFDGDFRKISWVDALGGVKFRAPLGSRAAILGRGDLAGFGSDLTWNVEGDLAFRASPRWTLGAGWRHLDIDYDKGEGLERKRLDIAYDGPRAWFAYSW
jgi:hypothetical protein